MMNDRSYFLVRNKRYAVVGTFVDAHHLRLGWCRPRSGGEAVHPHPSLLFSVVRPPVISNYQGYKIVKFVQPRWIETLQHGRRRSILTPSLKSTWSHWPITLQRKLRPINIFQCIRKVGQMLRNLPILMKNSCLLVSPLGNALCHAWKRSESLTRNVARQAHEWLFWLLMDVRVHWDF